MRPVYGEAREPQAIKIWRVGKTVRIMRACKARLCVSHVYRRSITASCSFNDTSCYMVRLHSQVASLMSESGSAMPDVVEGIIKWKEHRASQAEKKRKAHTPRGGGGASKKRRVECAGPHTTFLHTSCI